MDSTEKQAEAIKSVVGNKKKTIIISTIVAVLSASVGAIGGYVLYKNVNPEQDEIIIEKSKKYDVDKIEKGIAAKSLATDFVTDSYNLINYGADLYATETPYTLTIGSGLVKAAAGVNQTIESATYSHPDGVFNQKVSSSSLVKTADRYYDDNIKVLGYECKYPEDWKKEGIEAKEYTYDQYIQVFGKLMHGIYYCTDKTDVSDEEPIPEKFLTLSKEEYQASTESTKHERSGVIAYSLTEKAVSSSTIEKTDSGYHIELELNVAYAVSYMSVQMKATGRLKARPQFSKCTLTFELDDSLHFISSVFHDEYRVNTSGIVTNATSDLNQIYLTSNSENFEYQGNSLAVKVPAISEDFNGFGLISDKQ